MLDAGGLIDASMLDDADIDHGSIGGLGDDDHTQYVLADGSRDITGGITITGGLTRLGTGSTPDLAAGADDLFIEGILKVDGAARFDSTVLLAADPTLALQAATKQYVDTGIQSSDWQKSVLSRYDP